MSKLESVITGKSREPSRTVIYGRNGIGKTTFAAQSIRPIGILTEEGVGNLEFPRFPQCCTYNEVIECLDTLIEEEHEFRTVFIDSLDWTERLIFDHCETHYTASELGYGKKYEKAVHLWGGILDRLDILRTHKKMASILVGHSIVKRFDAPDSEGYDIYRLDLHDKSASFIRDWADVMLFANYRVLTKETSDGKRTIAVGEAERVLYTEERPAFWAKNRYGLPAELPLSFAAYASAMKAARSGGENSEAKQEANGSKPEQPEPVKAAH